MPRKKSTPTKKPAQKNSTKKASPAKKPAAKKAPVKKKAAAKSKPAAKAKPAATKEAPIRRVVKGKTPLPQAADPNRPAGSFVIFPTVCFQQEYKGSGIDKMNAELRRYILQIEKDQQSMTKSSIRGGHHSDRKLFEHKNWAVQQLRKLILRDTSNYLKRMWEYESTTPLDAFKNIQIHIGGWSMILREGDMSVPHLHPRANISGTYYVSMPPRTKDFDPRDGTLVLNDPRSRAPVFPVTNQCLTIRISPQAGTLIMFPSFIDHYVTPFRGGGERISIAFNIHFPRALGGIARTAIPENQEY